MRRRRSGRRRRLLVAQLSIVAIAAAVVATLTTVAVQMVKTRPAATTVAAAAREPSPALPSPVPSPVASSNPAPPRDYSALNAQLMNLIAASGGRVGIEVVDLAPVVTIGVQINVQDQFDAASTYKLPLLMANADGIARGTLKTTDRICFKDSELEDGWFADYSAGDCFTRQTLAKRAGQYSDNTAGHMLVDNLGGSRALNAFARAHGATSSAFFVPNTTTTADLAALLVSEVSGGAGGQPAQSWFYPLLTKTAFEAGLPRGVPAGVPVVHKIGAIDATVTDAGIVMNPKGAYVIAVMTDGIGGDAGYDLIAQISAAVWAFENR